MISALSTDLYEITMIGGYYVSGLSGRATFDLYVRQLPPTRQFLLAPASRQRSSSSRAAFTSEDIGSFAPFRPLNAPVAILR